MSRGTLFDIQHYAVHDGPGIRTLVFLKGCPLRCRWCCNPESHAPGKQLKHSEQLCRGCLSCGAACPNGAIGRLATGRPELDRLRCASCEQWACVEACPHDALRQVGLPIEASEVVAQVAKDIPFYRNSGGGVTFSGGEPFGQPSFLRELLEQSRRLEIHTAVETCGMARTEDVLALAELIDLFLFDLKIIDPALHRELTGADNSAILTNLRALARTPARERIVIRVPLVPGCTDSPANLEAIAELMSELELRSAALQPYHSLGSGKYRELGMPFSFEAPTVRSEAMTQAIDVFARRGISCEPATG